MYSITVKGREVEIEKGEVRVDGQVVGRADQKLKYGYHPAINLIIGDYEQWFELDTDHLLYKVASVTVHQIIKQEFLEQREKK